MKKTKKKFLSILVYPKQQPRAFKIRFIAMLIIYWSDMGSITAWIYANLQMSRALGTTH
ncbi:hypothetical protein THOE12_130062 [Vibrio rotiferianus]|nr:hypothetical protein THOE12_130062 [Vibrio rotiferianus]